MKNHHDSIGVNRPGHVYYSFSFAKYIKKYKRLFPLLLIYVIILLVFGNNELFADEVRFLTYAKNIVNHGYIFNPQDPQILNGWPYAILLVPFLAIGASFFIFRLLNVVMLFFAVVLLYETLLFYASKRNALILCYVFGLNFAVLYWLPLLYSEVFSLLLICSFLYVIHHFLKKDHFSIAYWVLSFFTLGILILTKLIFFYVCVTSLVIFGAYYLFVRRPEVLKISAVLAVALLFLVPYLFYTYSLTGKTFHLSNSSGEVMYWMSSRHEGEYGQWLSPASISEGQLVGVHPDHIAFLKSLEGKKREEYDELYMQKALENIREKPQNYILNVLTNPFRLILDYPASYSLQGFGMTPNVFFVFGLLIMPLLLGVYPAWVNRFEIPLELILLTIMICIYFGGTLLLATGHTIPGAGYSISYAMVRPDLY
jgi:hypothetical protein